MVGMITDRDIAVRGVAEGKGPDARIREVMSGEVKYCFEDEEVDDVLRNMGEIQVRRLPVVNRDKRLVGIVSLGDLAANGEAKQAGKALDGISQPGGEHSQTAH
jgi:CBS domain-containing protein